MTSRLRFAARLAAVCACTLAAAPVHAGTVHVILCGAGGEEEFQKKFSEWGTRLHKVLVSTIQVPADRVHLLAESAVADIPQSGAISLEAIQQLFGKISPGLTDKDELYVYLIGHGGYVKKESKFHIPGPDMTSLELDRLLDAAPAGRVIVLNGGSTSAGFINDLSGPNRVICTATKSVDEYNATEFMHHFVTGLEDGSADLNHDDRISFLEACEQAVALTSAWFTGEGLIATEHAILDDNGDGLGSRLPLTQQSNEILASAVTQLPPVFDGLLARECFLKDFTFPPGVPPATIEAYLEIMDDIEALKRNKANLDEAEYYRQLEAKLIQAAKTNREIRSYIQPADVQPSKAAE